MSGSLTAQALAGECVSRARYQAERGGTPRGLRGRLGALAGLVTGLLGLLAARWADLPGTTRLSIPVSTYTADVLAGALLA